MKLGRSFVAIDVETANADLASICAVGLWFHDEEIGARSTHFLIDPEDRFDPLNVSIHGIDEEAVRGAPTMAAVLPLLSNFLSGQIVVHHTHFDRAALGRAAIRHDRPHLACDWLDTARIARRAWPAVSHRGYGLRALADRLGFDFRHHDAREDARASAEILSRAIAATGIDVVGWLARVEEPLDPTLGDSSRPKLAGNPRGHLAGEIVVFTGTLSMPRRKAAAMAAAAGCNVDPGVTKATTILVVGDQDIRRVGADGKSSKQEKAEAMITAGDTIRIVGESDFRLMARK